MCETPTEDGLLKAKELYLEKFHLLHCSFEILEKDTNDQEENWSSQLDKLIDDPDLISHQCENSIWTLKCC